MNKKLYWISSFTWGLLGTIVGFFVWLFFKCLKKKSDTYKGSVRTVIGDMTNGGCFSIGIFIFVSDKSDWINNHEFGHCIQNAMYGLLMPFMVWIPSVVDYIKCSKTGDFNPHNELWCEKQATDLGYQEW